MIESAGMVIVVTGVVVSCLLAGVWVVSQIVTVTVAKLAELMTTVTERTAKSIADSIRGPIEELPSLPENEAESAFLPPWTEWGAEEEGDTYLPDPTYRSIPDPIDMDNRRRAVIGEQFPFEVEE